MALFGYSILYMFLLFAALLAQVLACMEAWSEPSRCVNLACPRPSDEGSHHAETKSDADAQASGLLLVVLAALAAFLYVGIIFKVAKFGF